MKSLYKFIVAGVFIISPYFALAIQPSTPQTPQKGIDTTEHLIERGGTISKVNLKTHMLVVDGVTYNLPAVSFPIHAPSDLPPSTSFELKAQMQIRFNTSKGNWSGHEQVKEIWVIDQGSKPSRP